MLGVLSEEKGVFVYGRVSPCPEGDWSEKIGFEYSYGSSRELKEPVCLRFSSDFRGGGGRD